MKKIALLTLGASLLLTYVAQAEVVTKTLDVKPFNRIEVSGSSSVVIEQGEPQSVSVTIEHDYLPRVNTDVKDGELEIFVREKGWFGGSAQGAFHVVVPDLEAVIISGSGSARVGAIKAKTFHIEVNGSGDIGVDELTSEKVRISLAGSGDIRMANVAALMMGVEIMGSGDIDASGEVAQLKVEIMGSGDFDGSELDTAATKGEIIGSGDIVVRSAATSHFSSLGSGDGRILNPSPENQ